MKTAGRLLPGPWFALALLGPLASGQEAITPPPTQLPAPEVTADSGAPSQAPRIIINMPVDNPPPAEPVPAAETPDFTVLSTVRNVVPGEGRSIIVHRVAPSAVP